MCIRDRRKSEGEGLGGGSMKTRGRTTRARSEDAGEENEVARDGDAGKAPEGATEGAVPNDDFLCLFDESAREEPAALNGAWEDVFAQHHHANAPQGGVEGGFHQGSEDAGEHFPQSGYVDTVQYKLPTTRPGVASTSRGRVTKSRSGTRTSGSRKPKPISQSLPPRPQAMMAPIPQPMSPMMYRSPGGKPRSSRYNGVCRHAKSGRYEAHVWLRESRRQVYLGGHLEEEFAAEAFDIIVLKLARIGDRSRTGTRPLKMNFPESRYANLIGFIDSLTLDELIMEVRRHSEGFARGNSGYRGVTQHSPKKFEARLGVPPQSKHVYLGLYDSAEKAAVAYDTALIQARGRRASTNFPIYNYDEHIRQYEEAVARNPALEQHEHGQYEDLQR